VRDVTDTFADTESGVIRGALDSGREGHRGPLFGFDGLVGREIQPDRRLGTELSDHAKRHGAGGIFHTDELPAYGVTETEVAALRDAVGAGEEDAVAIVAADPETADLAIEAAAERAETAIEGVPEETRGANDDGTTRYLRPLPGAARMYPETDVPPVEPTPPTWTGRNCSTRRPPGTLRRSGSTPVSPSRSRSASGSPVRDGGRPRRRPHLRRVDAGVDDDGDPARRRARREPERRPLPRALRSRRGRRPREGGRPEVLTTLAEHPELSAAEAVEEAGLSGVSEAEVREAVVEVVERNADQIEAEGMGAFSGLMGEAMGALRGKADGEVVSDALREEIGKRS